jgi:hypothetical protein
MLKMSKLNAFARIINQTRKNQTSLNALDAAPYSINNVS